MLTAHSITISNSDATLAEKLSKTVRQYLAVRLYGQVSKRLKFNEIVGAWAGCMSDTRLAPNCQTSNR